MRPTKTHLKFNWYFPPMSESLPANEPFSARRRVSMSSSHLVATCDVRPQWPIQLAASATPRRSSRNSRSCRSRGSTRRRSIRRLFFALDDAASVRSDLSDAAWPAESALPHRRCWNKPHLTDRCGWNSLCPRYNISGNELPIDGHHPAPAVFMSQIFAHHLVHIIPLTWV